MKAQTQKPQAGPSRCPECQAIFCLEPTAPTGEVPCPYCRRPLWFVWLYHRHPEVFYYPAGDVSARKRAAILEVFGRWVSLQRPGLLNRLRLGSTDLVEFILDFEERLDPRRSGRVWETLTKRLSSFGEFLDWVIYDCPE
jgi:hypothetical protein